MNLSDLDLENIVEIILATRDLKQFQIICDDGIHFFEEE